MSTAAKGIHIAPTQQRPRKRATVTILQPRPSEIMQWELEEFLLLTRIHTEAHKRLEETLARALSVCDSSQLHLSHPDLIRLAKVLCEARAKLTQKRDRIIELLELNASIEDGVHIAVVEKRLVVS